MSARTMAPPANAATVTIVGPAGRPGRARVPRKRSYTVACPSALVRGVEALAARRGVNAADLARSVLLLVAPADLARVPDPGEPAPDDREPVTVRSGPARGRPWRRKPRLQLRLPAGFAHAEIRRALALALEAAAGRVPILVGPPRRGEDGQAKRLKALLARADEDIERLRAAVAVLAGPPLPEGVQTPGDALFVLGFPPDARPSDAEVRARYRRLATVHHPDSPSGDTRRMTQLNAAADLLRRSPA